MYGEKEGIFVSEETEKIHYENRQEGDQAKNKQLFYYITKLANRSQVSQL